MVKEQMDKKYNENWIVIIGQGERPPDVPEPLPARARARAPTPPRPPPQGFHSR